MAQQAGKERNHGPRHTGHFDELAEEYKQRNRQQDQMADALVNAAHDDERRRPRGEHEIAERRQTERKGDRHAGEYGARHHNDEEDDEVDVAKRPKEGLEQPKQAYNERDSAERRKDQSGVSEANEPKQCKYAHQPEANRCSGGAPCIGEVHRRSSDDRFLDGVLERGRE